MLQLTSLNCCKPVNDAVINAVTFRPLWRLDLLSGQTRLLVERLRRIGRVLDDLRLLLVFVQQTLQPARQRGNLTPAVTETPRPPSLALNSTRNKAEPLRVLPAFVLGVLAATLVRPVLPVLPLPAPLLPVLVLGGLAAARHDAVQHPLVSVRVGGVSFDQRFKLVPHGAILFVSARIKAG